MSEAVRKKRGARIESRRGRWIGTSPPRPDGVPKATGGLRYADDIPIEGLFWGATLRSPHPHARIRSLRWLPGLAPEQATAVTAADLPGPNEVKLVTADWPILAANEVNHVGEAIALVAAPDRQSALLALAGFDVEYEVMSPVLDLDAAAECPPLAELKLEHGDVAGGFARAAHVIEGVWTTGHQEHIYIECQTMTAWIEGDGTLVVQGSMQCPYFVHTSLVHALEQRPEKIRVVATPTGGGFGGKEDYPSLLALHVALLTRATGRPVRIVYDRHEDIIATTKRHPSVIRHRTAVDEEGRLEAMEVDIVLDGGAYTTLSPVVLSRAVLHAGGPYRCPNIRIRGRALRTHTATNGAFRGFGAPQAQFAMERQIDRIARRLGIHPLDLRRRNLLEPGDSLPTGQILDDSTAAGLCLEAVAEATDFAAQWEQLEARRRECPEEPRREGVGLSLYFHGAGFTGNGERRLNSTVKARLAEDGRIEVLSAAVDMGQGSGVLFPMLAAEASGLRDRDIRVVEPDTREVPDSGPSVASRTSMIVGSEAARAVEELARRIVEAWAERLGEPSPPSLEGGMVTMGRHRRSFREIAGEHFRLEGAVEVIRRHEPPEWQVFDDDTYQGVAYPTYAWGADVVRVEVDADTLEVRPVQVTAVCEVGRVLHPVLCRGQIEGGTLQALGWALLEEVKLEQGRYLNDRLSTYIIPTCKDSPKMDIHLLERPWAGGLVGAKGVGELPMDGAAPAVVAAIENAIGLDIDAIPATPERLLSLQESDRWFDGESRE